MDRFDNMPEIALDWVREGRKVALATVVQTWGSAPRRVGAQLVISDEGAIEGSVSGGCVEGAVVTEALEAIEKAKSAYALLVEASENWRAAKRKIPTMTAEEWAALPEKPARLGGQA